MIQVLPWEDVLFKDWSTLFCLHWEIKGHGSLENLLKRWFKSCLGKMCYLRIEVHFFVYIGKSKDTGHMKILWSASHRFTRDPCPFISQCILANSWECWGGVMTPHWIAASGGHSARRLFRIHLYFLTILKHISLIHRILNERETSHLHQDHLNLYIFMYWVLFVVL